MLKTSAPISAAKERYSGKMPEHDLAHRHAYIGDSSWCPAVVELPHAGRVLGPTIGLDLLEEMLNKSACDKCSSEH
jgi:hypothetical protein